MGRKSLTVIALTVLTSSQGILIAISKNNGTFDYSVVSANLTVEFTKCVISLGFLVLQWQKTGVTHDNTLHTTVQEIWVYPVPAFLYLIKVHSRKRLVRFAFCRELRESDIPADARWLRLCP